MSYVNFGAIPPFVCIKSVYMSQFMPWIVQPLLPLLKQFSGNFITSPKFHLNSSIGLDSNFYSLKSADESFKGEAEFVSCLHGTFEIFEQCLPPLTFCVNSPKQIDILALIASALELLSVQVSEKVHFLLPAHIFISLFVPYVFQKNKVKVISDWLHRPYVRGGTPPTEYICIRSLTIGSTQREDGPMKSSQNNIEQLIEDLKEVSFSI